MAISLPFAEQFFASLEGEWFLHRRINGVDMMRGKASFVRGPQEEKNYAYREEGRYIPSSLKEVSFFKEYVYSLNQDVIEIYGALQAKKIGFLHTLEFGGSSIGTGAHACGSDMYYATCERITETCFRLLYKVEGPRKKYVINTLFERL